MKKDRPASGGTPLVSVVIPAYNVRPYIAQCLDSVRGQTYENLEIILVDDGSTDGTEHYCDEAAVLDKRITVLHQKNRGVVSARNAGIGSSHGKYLAFVDGDDWVESGMIAEMVGQIGPSDMISVGVYQEQSPDRVIERIDRFAQGTYEGGQAMAGLYGKMIYDQETGCLQPMTSWIYNKLYVCSKAKEIHEKISKDLVFAEDSVFLYLYMLECKSVVICGRCFYHYRYREGSAIHKINENMLADINKVYLSLADTFRRHPMGAELLYQLQKWTAVKACIAVNEAMGFDGRIHIPEFIADLGRLQDKDIVLYGAGRVGRDTYGQMKEFGFKAVLWVDREYGRYQKQGLPVSSPKEIPKCCYDLVFIAVEDEKVAEEIGESMAADGVPKDRIVWRRPMKLY